MLTHLLLTSMGLIGFWLYYYLVLRKTTFFNLKRGYFVTVITFCMIFPFSYHLVTINQGTLPLEETQGITPYTNSIATSIQGLNTEVRELVAQTSQEYSWAIITYFMVGGLFALRFLWSFFSISHLIRDAKTTRYEGIKIFYSAKIKTPFALFRSIYLPDNLNKIPDEIVWHEKEHVKQFHFIDLFLIELITIIFWFNPIVYFFKKSMRLNLEYLADRAVIAKGTNVLQYQSILLSSAMDNKFKSPLTTNFSTQLKNRIEMMKKRKTQIWKRITVLGTIPMAALLVAMNTENELTPPITEIIPINEVFQVTDIPSGSPLSESTTTKITSGFGKRFHPFLKVEKLHTGIDLKANLGTPIYATADGHISIAKSDPDWGNFIEISHSDIYQTRYAHMNSYVVFSGQFVKKGQLIGYVGNSGKSKGPHLHYEVHKEGNPVDPKSYIEGC